MSDIKKDNEMSDSSMPEFVQGIEPEAAPEPKAPEAEKETPVSAETQSDSTAAHIAELNRSARSELSASAAAMSAASAVAILEKEAENHSVEAVIPESSSVPAEEEKAEQTEHGKPSESTALKAPEAPEEKKAEAKKTFEDPGQETQRKAPPKKKPAGASAKGKKKKKKKKSRFNGTIFGGIIIVSIILTVSLLIAVTGIKLGMEFYGIGKSESDIRFNIPEGSNNDKIADILVENGVIQNKTLFKIALKLQHDPTLYPGDITLQPSNGYQDIIEKLSVQRESYESVTVTFAEGENLITIADKLEEAKVCEADDFIFEFNRDQGLDFEKLIDKDADTFYAREGYFAPNTYEFYVNDSAENVAKKVKEQFQKQYTTSIEPKMSTTKLTFQQVMTLASIVQLESASVEEMPNVASVFINRLNDPDTFPMLQSDTTSNYIKQVINAQADTASARTHYAESYDTYSCKGLPAGPICNPGIDAILAVINPAKTNYYYFCNNLTTKQTFYAKTLEEHEANLKKAGLA